MEYIFKSERLGFRTWRSSDIELLHQINSNPEVMRYFPGLPSIEETHGFVERMIVLQEQYQCCYFPVELLEGGTFIGFIGLCYQDYEATFNPNFDIGWRIDPEFWKRGLATEGAEACLKYAQNTLGLKKIIAVAPEVNSASIAVMRKIGMLEKEKFNHPKLLNHIELRSCVLFEIIFQ